MATPIALEIPYGGTISSEPETDVNVPIKEFYRLPLKQKNEISLVVMAASNARVILYDGDTGANVTPSPYKVELVIGGDGNSTASIGLSKEDAQWPKEVVGKKKLLSATHWKAFTIRWHYGRVMLYNVGYNKPLITWDGPKDCAFNFVGVRTVGCSGEWRVQGLPRFTTADGAEFKPIEINSGRLDFEVSALRDAYVMFTPAPKADRAPSIHCMLGIADALYTCIWYNFTQPVAVHEATAPLSTNEYRRFWCQWDANNFMIGRGDDVAPFAQWLKCGTPVKIKYFGLQANIVNDYCFWHILERVRDEDTSPRTHGQQDYSGAELGYSTFEYSSHA